MMLTALVAPHCCPGVARQVCAGGAGLPARETDSIWSGNFRRLLDGADRVGASRGCALPGAAEPMG